MNKKINFTTPTSPEVVSIWETNKISRLELNPYLDYNEIINCINLEYNNYYKILDHRDFIKLDRWGHETRFSRVNNISKLRNFFEGNKDISRFLFRYFNQNIRSVVEIKKQKDDDLEWDDDQNYLQIMGTDYLVYKEEVNLNITLSNDKSFFNIELDNSVVHCENVCEDIIDVPLTKKEVNFLKDKVKKITFNLEVLNYRGSNGDIEHQDCILESGDGKYLRSLYHKIKKYIRQPKIQDRLKDCIRKETKTEFIEDNADKYDLSREKNRRYLSPKYLIGENKNENIKVSCCTRLNYWDEGITTDLGDGSLTFSDNKLKFKITQQYTLQKPSSAFNCSKRNTKIEEKVTKILELENEWYALENKLMKKLKTQQEKVQMLLDEKQSEIDNFRENLLTL